MREWALMRQLLTDKHTSMHVAPAFRNVGKDLVKRPANELYVEGEAEIEKKATRDGEEAHLAIEHGDCCRRLLDKRGELRLALDQLCL